ncbi:MAG: hypothetical protein J5712_05335 [Lachnospiraceae bacterium]|nr:hypothetical protein [Lachnospiraceae bacterium]MBO4559485.1 hypothetical protein [Lachnospiraceae bacterium]MBR5731891.1 hypothetical protein [Lachnospiraceae bacterium]
MDKPLITLIILVVMLTLLIYVSVRNPAKNPLTRLIRIILFLGLVIAIVIIAVKEYGPNGKNPIFSEAGRGEHEGQDDKQTSPGVSAEQGGVVYVEVTVRGFEVSIGDTVYDCSNGRYESADAALQECVDAGRAFRLIDDYAVSSFYHHVREILSSKGAYIEEVVFGQ